MQRPPVSRGPLWLLLVVFAGGADHGGSASSVRRYGAMYGTMAMLIIPFVAEFARVTVVEP